MDKTLTAVDALRERLKVLDRKDILALADDAKVARSTVEKIKFGHIEEPGATKVERLFAALDRRDAKA